jgi:AcrR family transcriptional regulator
MSEGIDDIEVEIVSPRERLTPEKPKRPKRPKSEGEKPREPASGRLLESKVDFLEEVMGGARGLAEWIRSDVEKMLHEWFYDYLEDVLRSEDIPPEDAFETPGVMDALEEAWDKIRVEAVDYILERFADYIERKYGLEGMAERYLHCWIGPEFSCSLDKRRVLRDLEEASILPFRYVMEDVIDELLDIILYSMAETEKEG